MAFLTRTTAMLTMAGLVASAGTATAQAPAGESGRDCKAVHATLVEDRTTTGCKPEQTFCFVGSVDGALLTIRVAVTDTVARRTVTLGPVAVTRGREPRMGPCPICRRPDE